MYQVALIIPCTSNGRPEWKSINDTYLMKFSLKSFLLTTDASLNYTYYIGYDSDDRIFSDITQQAIIKRYNTVFKHVSFKFIPFENIKKGHVTKMWNILFQKAFDDGCNYFYQCGDDISFKTKGWSKDCIKVLKENNDIGISGPINNNNRILTQAMVSRKHMEIFGWFFPDEIINWCCDDWYNWVYQPNHFYPLRNHFCSNDGGTPRYEINNNKNFKKRFSENTQRLRQDTMKLAKYHQRRIKKYLSDQK
jgi:hypothetical protein